MTRIGIWLATIAVACAAGAAAAAAPLEAYGKLPFIEAATISPDGKLLAVVTTDGEQRSVTIEDLATSKPVGAIRAGSKKLRDIQWGGSGHLLLTVTSTGLAAGVISAKTEWSMVVDYNVATHRQRQLLADVPESMNVVEDTPTMRTIGGRPYAFVTGVQFVDNQGEGRGSLFKVDLDLDKAKIVAMAAPKTDQWLVDAAGEPVAQTTFDPAARKWVLMLRRNGAWRTVKTIEASVEHPFILGLGRDDKTLLIGDWTDNGDAAVRELAPDADDWGPPTLQLQYLALIFDPVTSALVGTHEMVGDDERYAFFAPYDRAVWNATVKASPGERVSLAAMSQDRHRLVVVVDSPSAAPSYFLVNIDAKSAVPIGPIYDSLKPQDIGETRSIAFKAADGLPLTGYLTLPHGSAGKSLPLVVFPHGGPAARDMPGFDWWTQAMASRGYAVLRVNYRGSDGLGWDLLKAGYGEWGRKMQTDLSDGVRYLAGQGVIDPKRVCIVGASYGGYAALAGATLDPGVYRCAVSVAGPADLRRFVAWAKDRSNVAAERYWTRFMGANDLKDAHLEAISPADHADRATIPILLIHGKDDTVVPFEQSQMMADALRNAGKPTDLVVLKHEDHWLTTGDTRLQMLQATIDFLEKNNPPQ